MYLTGMKLSTPHDTDGLIAAFDGLLSPYYGRLPKDEIDYQYMSSMGVCYADQLRRGLSWDVYDLLHRAYPDSMYPPFTVAEARESFLSDDNPLRDENVQLLTAIANDEDDVKYTPEGHAMLNIETTRFRVRPDLVTPILTDGNDSPVLTTRNRPQLTDSQTELRNLVQQRSLTAAQFKEKVAELKPDLADFLDEVQRTGGLHYRLHPVGFVIAKHVIASHAPKMAEAVDAALEENM